MLPLKSIISMSAPFIHILFLKLLLPRPYYKKTYAIGQNVRQVLIIVGHVYDTIKKTKQKKKQKKTPISYHILDGAQASCLYSAVYEKNEVLKLCT